MDQAIKFADIFKKSFFHEGQLGSINSLDIAAVLLASLFISLFIFFIYLKTYRGISYHNSYNISLVMMSLITSMLILTISSNVVLSLGMLGALSIVRFRTPVKESMDIVFIFWAISVGIATGARFYLLAVLGSLFIGVVLLAMTRYTYVSSNYLLIVHYGVQAENLVYQKLGGLKYQVKSKAVSQGKVEMTIEIKSRLDKVNIENEISSLEGVTNTVLIKSN